MTDLVARKSLLPLGYPPVPVAVVDVDGRLDDIDTASIYNLKNPDKTPVAFLPFLAWEVRVDVWNPNWSEEIKRAVIKAAPEVHRYKGTRYAVQKALGAFGITATITEWWQASPKGAPYTFDVTAFVQAPTEPLSGPLLSADLISDVYAAVAAAKPETRAFGLIVAADMPSTMGIAPVAVAKSKTAVAMTPKNERELSSTLGIAPVVIARSKTAIAMTPKNERRLASTLGVAPTLVSRQRVSVSFDFASLPQ